MEHVGIFWEIDQLFHQIKALEDRAMSFPKEREYCENKIKELQEKLQQLLVRIKYG